MSPPATRAAEKDEGAPREGPPRQFVGFRVDRADYAVAIRSVQEIILMPPITRLPQVAEEVAGLMNLRGDVLPVLDLRRRFGLPAKPADDHSRVVVVNVRDKTAGLIVDEVSQVFRVAEGDLQDAPPGIDSAARGAIDGLFREGGRLVVVLAADRVLDPSEFGLDHGPGGPPIPTRPAPNLS